MKIVNTIHRGLRLLFAVVFALWAGLVSAQQPYPNKPIRFIVPYPPGGSPDIVGRIVAPKLAESWGQQVIIDNRGGGNTIIGTEAVARSPADGHTLLLAATAQSIVPLLLPTPYDAIKDFAAVATIARSEFVLALNAAVPASNLQELIALARSKPGQLNFASSGSGGANHLAGELLNLMAGIKVQHIPYKGTGPALSDLLGGQVQMFFNTPIVVLPQLKSGKLKAIAITGAARTVALPQVPTFAESGFADFNISSWNGLFAPAATPRANVDKLSGEIAKILALSDVKEKLASQGLDPFISTPDQFATLMKVDMAKFAEVIKAANIKAEP